MDELDQKLDEELKRHMEIMKHSAIDNINGYVEKVLTEANEFCPIKTYIVIQNPHFEAIKEQADEAIKNNPNFELAASVGKILCVNAYYWIAVLVEYDFALKEQQELQKSR